MGSLNQSGHLMQTLIIQHLQFKTVSDPGGSGGFLRRLNVAMIAFF
jgi:hypothetical protein